MSAAATQRRAEPQGWSGSSTCPVGCPGEESGGGGAAGAAGQRGAGAGGAAHHPGHQDARPGGGAGARAGRAAARGASVLLCRDYVIDACSAGGVVPCRTPEQGCLDSLESAVARWFTTSTVTLRRHAADGTGSKCHLAAARCRRGCRSGRRGSWRRWRACCRPQLMLFRPPGRDRAGVCGARTSLGRGSRHALACRLCTDAIDTIR